MTVPMLMPNAAAAAIEMEFKARAGARTVVSACASSNESIGNALDHLRLGYADVIIAGGTEACVHALPLAAFAQMQALSKRNDAPEHASRPYDSGRDGFVLGEGAAALDPRARGARQGPRGEDLRRASLGGARDERRVPHQRAGPRRHGAARAMQLALEDAGLDAEDVAHINAHATSTPVGDIAEYKSMRERLRRPPRRASSCQRHEGGDRPPARRGRRDRGGLHGQGAAASGSRRRRSTSPTPTPRSRSTSRRRRGRCRGRGRSRSATRSASAATTPSRSSRPA